MNVLIADDDAMVLETIRKYVTFRGDKPFTAPNGQLAIDILGEESIDLVITDIQMPEATGFDVLRVAKGCNPEVPVIIITGYADLDRATQAVNEGAFAFLSKPIMFSDLTSKMDEAFAALQGQREVQREIQVLQQTTADQEVRIAQAQALSVSILNNIPFPVCVIDYDRHIHIANPAFCEQLAAGISPMGRALEEAVSGLNFSPFALKEVFSVFRDPKNAAGFTLSVVGEDESVQYFHITGFELNEAELTAEEFDMPLTCLFMRDVTLRVLQEEEAAERQWHLREVSDFREMTNVSEVDFAHQVVEHLANAFGHYNEAFVQLIHKGKIYEAGNKIERDIPYLVRSLFVGDQEIGRVSVFGQNPQRVHLQRGLMDDLVEILVRRIEAHEFQMGVVQSERLRALGEMAAGVAHELNQPLAGIRTFAEGLLYGLKNDWDLEQMHLDETLKDIVGQVERASEIIDFMRNFSRPPVSEASEYFSVAEVIDNVLKLVGAQLKVHGILLHVSVAPDLPLCEGRPRQIEQVLLNLLVNARHALDAQVEVFEQERDEMIGWKPQLDIVAEAVAQHVIISVSDTGGGIPETIADRIFEPFFTSKEVGEGTGLGLSISRNIVQAHGGDLQLVNRLGQGATFSVSLKSSSRENGNGKTEGRSCT